MSKTSNPFVVRIVNQDSIIPVQYFNKIEEAAQFALALFGSSVVSVSIWDEDSAQVVMSLFR